MSTRAVSDPPEALQSDARSVVSEDDHGDARSVASTQATTASLASRLVVKTWSQRGYWFFVLTKSVTTFQDCIPHRGGL